MTSITTSDLSALFGAAGQSGALSQAALNAININDIGTDIQDALGVSVDDITTSEVTLVSLLIDDSGSIRMAGNSQVVRDGHNLVLDSLSASKQSASILTMCRYLNGTVLYPYIQLGKAAHMDAKNYNPTGGTPLYDEAVTTLAAVAAKAQEFDDNGIACRTVTVIVTDGGDSGSRRSTPANVTQLVRDMLRQERHVIAFMGIDDGYTNFKDVASGMGIPDEWVLTPGNSASEIRKAFAVVSQSAVRASQGAASFSQTAMGGFGAP